MTDQDEESTAQCSEPGVDTQRQSLGANKLHVILLSTLLVAVGVMLLIALVQVWPMEASDSTKNCQPSNRVLFWPAPTSREARIFLISLIAGAIGGITHAMRSLSWYVGNRYLMRSWLLRYLLLPILGSALAVTSYMVWRGLLTTGATDSQGINPFGVGALSALVGLFTSETANKLKTVFQTILAPGDRGKDHVDDTNQTSTPKGEQSANPQGA